PGRFLGLKLLARCRPGNSAGSVARQGCLPALEPARPAVGARVKVCLARGRTMTSQVDGGSGHSGKRAQELHFGLGDVPADKPVAVEIWWRTPAGQLRQEKLNLLPGWHTIELLWDKEQARR
ncbi:MAG TPA: ASPIC/UnbV domain-containing protein, partial [Candidatus Obscuribacterales bacterium]